MSEIFKNLSAIFPFSQLSWKVGFTSRDKSMGQALPHIDARVVQNRLDEVVGPSNWKNSYQEVFMGSQLFSVRCQLSLRIDGEWITKEDAAQLQGGDSDRNTQVKGAYSDALKRAAVQWGIGRYLYEYTPEMVPLDDKGHLSVIPDLPETFLLPADQAAQQEAKALRDSQTVETAQAPVSANVNSQEQEPVRRTNEQNSTAVKVTKAVSAAVVSVDMDISVFSSNDQTIIAELLERLKKHAPSSLRTYVTGPKGQANLSEDARKYLLLKIDQREQAMAAAQAPAPAPTPVPAPAPTPAPAPAPTPAPAPAPEASSTVLDAQGLPVGLPPDQISIVTDLLERLKKHSPSILRAYVQGPKGQQKLGEIAREFLLQKIDAKEKSELGQ